MQRDGGPAIMAPKRLDTRAGPGGRGLRPLDRRRSEPRHDCRRRPPSPLRIARASERPDRPGRLVAAFQAWTRDKARSLADHLEAHGDLTDEEKGDTKKRADISEEPRKGGHQEKGDTRKGAHRANRRPSVDPERFLTHANMRYVPLFLLRKLIVGAVARGNDRHVVGSIRLAPHHQVLHFPSGIAGTHSPWLRTRRLRRMRSAS